MEKYATFYVAVSVARATLVLNTFRPTVSVVAAVNHLTLQFIERLCLFPTSPSYLFMGVMSTPVRSRLRGCLPEDPVPTFLPLCIDIPSPNPICWFVLLGTLSPRAQRLPIVLHRTTEDFNCIHRNYDCVECLHDERVNTGQSIHISFVEEIRFLQHKPALVLKDQMRALGISVLVGGVTVHLIFNVQVTSTFLNIPLALGRGLHDQPLSVFNNPR